MGMAKAASTDSSASGMAMPARAMAATSFSRDSFALATTLLNGSTGDFATGPAFGFTFAAGRV